MKTKYCKGCDSDLPTTPEYFAGRTDRKIPTLQTLCRKCQSNYKKQHYAENKAKYIEQAAHYKKEVAEWFDDYKKNLSCGFCSESRWWVLDFHHVDEATKEYSLAVLKWKGSKKKILEELEKCVVLCSNCHRDLHYQARIAHQVEH